MNIIINEVTSELRDPSNLSMGLGNHDIKKDFQTISNTIFDTHIVLRYEVRKTPFATPTIHLS